MSKWVLQSVIFGSEEVMSFQERERQLEKWAQGVKERVEEMKKMMEQETEKIHQAFEQLKGRVLQAETNLQVLKNERQTPQEQHNVLGVNSGEGITPSKELCRHTTLVRTVTG